MFLFDIPESSTLESLVTELAPKLHAEHVPANAGSEPTVIGFHYTGGGGSYRIAADGTKLTAEKGRADDAEIWAATPKRVASIFLADWTSTKALLPTFSPPGDMKMITDPRILKRLKMVSGRIELAITDFPGGPATLTAACGSIAKKGVITDEPDVRVETTMKTYERILSGSLSPEEALADGDVKITGKKLVAMQFAMAIAPLYPAPPK